MKTLRIVNMEEAAFVSGGIDKKAQDALYTIGYIIGIVARVISSLFAISNKRMVNN